MLFTLTIKIIKYMAEIIQHPNDVKCEKCGNILIISTDGIKYKVEECPCVSTKTWQEEFKNKFQYGNRSIELLEKFIIKLRKHDEDELIKELPGYCLSDDVEVNTTEIIKKYYESK